MNKKKWALLLLCAVLLFGYIKLFYKTYSNNVVAQSADCIIAIDVKRITNTLIWNFLTAPGQWKPGNIFKRSSGKGEISWKDMIEIPDYIFAFHAANQPVNTWYSVFTIKDKAGFEKGLLHYHFTTQDDKKFLSEEIGLSFFKFDNKILVSNNKENNGYLEQVADEVFTKKNYTAKATLKKAVDAKSHAAIYIAANKYLQQDGIITANFSKQTIKIEGEFNFTKEYRFTQEAFDFSSSSLFVVGFTQPSQAVYNLISDSSKTKVSRALNLDIDSLFRTDNKYYRLDMAEFISRTDSAITYTYDEDFNKVEKVVANNVQEPAYNFLIAGDSVVRLYNHFVRSNKLEQTDAGLLFTPVPFVKSYCALAGEKILQISATNYLNASPDQGVRAVLFFNLLLSKIPKNLLNYLPDAVVKAISNIESINLTLNKKEEGLTINAVIQKKKNDLPIIKL
jgi:hypothetical protein